MKDKEKSGKSRSLSRQEADLWQAMTSDVKRMPGKKYQQGIEKYEDSSERPRRCGGERIVLESKKPGKIRQGTELDRRTEERLRRGQMEIEATLDLHGMTQAKAQEALESFIQRAFRQGKRCVLVVTGKGNTRGHQSDDWLAAKPGVIKRSVPEWLRHKPLNELVLQFYPARAKHGGEGALYVYLRRQRE